MTAQPHEVVVRAVLTRGERPAEHVAEDVEWLRANGAGIAEICSRMDMSVHAITRALYRAGRPDLANPFSAESLRQRRAAGWVRPRRRAA